MLRSCAGYLGRGGGSGGAGRGKERLIFAFACFLTAAAGV